MAVLAWTEHASLTLHACLEYVAIDNPAAASKLGLNIYQKVQLLSSFPYMGQVFLEKEEVSIRALHYGSYRILYEVTADESTVNILGVFHTAMHPDNYKL
ncbi:MAG: type II toxin-antitoxin system RelE/ParE family toxin [Planctomycetota bacterium]